MDIALTVIWVVGAIVTWYPASEWVISAGGRSPREEDVFYGRVEGFVVACCWPVIVVVCVPWVISRWLYTHSPWKVGGGR